MEEFSKFKEECQKELWDFFQPAFSKVEEDPAGIFDHLRTGSPRAFVLKGLFGTFYEKFDDIEKENRSFKKMIECESKECDKCQDLMRVLRASSSSVNKLSNRCAYLFSRLTSDVQKQLGNNWLPSNMSPSDSMFKGDFVFSNSPVFGIGNDSTEVKEADTFVLPKQPETPTRSPLTPVKTNSPSMLQSKDGFLSPLVFQKRSSNDVEDRENRICFAEEINFSPINNKVPAIPNIKSKEEGLTKTPPPTKNTPRNGSSRSRKSSGCNTKSSTVENHEDSDTEINSEDILLPTPPSSLWIKPITPKGGSSRSRVRVQDKETKKMKQQTLIAMSKNFPKQTVDISTLKEFRGGSRPTTGENIYPVKRKSDEMNPQTTPSPVRLMQDRVPVAVTSPNFEDLDMTVFEPPPELSFVRIRNAPVVSTSSRTETVSKAPDYNYANPDPDETFPEPEPTTWDKFNSKTKTKTKINLNSTEELIKDFDKIPERIKVDDFGKPVRKKEERAKLSGWTCDQCRLYYEGLKSQMHPTELQRLKDKCSRHRSNRPMDLNDTPVDYWITKLPTTQEAYEQGYIKVGIASPPIPKRRHDLLDDDN